MEHKKYIVISSKHSKDYFPNNHPSHFRVCLEHYIDFKGPYECALMDFTCSTTSKKCIHILQYDIRKTNRWQLRHPMRHTTVQRGRLEMEKFILPYYIPVKPTKPNILEVCIKDENGKEVSFL